MTRLEVPRRPIVGLRAANPGPFTLSGTNTWIVAEGPAWLVDPGPALPAHIDAIAAELERRGGLAGIVLTHDHADHAEAVAPIRDRFPGTVLAAARGDVDHRLRDGDTIGPLQVIVTPGHAPDHLAFILGDAALTGDAVLGEGSVFIAPDPGALRGYLDALQRLRRSRPALLLPGHGPIVEDPAARITQYVDHRRDRERRLLEALAGGARSVPEMLESAWGEVPDSLRPAAAATLAAHLDKLDDEGRLPLGVQRPLVPTTPVQPPT